MPYWTFNNLKVLEMGPLRFSKGDIYVPLQEISS